MGGFLSAWRVEGLIEQKELVLLEPVDVQLDGYNARQPNLERGGERYSN
jgi:hypothetical protein